MDEVDPSASAKMAVALALLRSRDARPDLEEDVQHWKKKAKERKRELHQLKDELKSIQDQTLQESLQNTMYCKCYFFDNCIDATKQQFQDKSCPSTVNDVVYQSFVRQACLLGRKKRSGSVKQGLSKDVSGQDNENDNSGTHFSPYTCANLPVMDEINSQNHQFCGLTALSIMQRQLALTKTDFYKLGVDWVSTIKNEDEERFCMAADFLVELINQSIVVSGPAFATLSHQALEIILASIKGLLNSYAQELLEEATNKLMSHLLRRMCSSTTLDGSDDVQFQVQHLIRKLGSEPYISQRTLLLVTQRVCALVDKLYSMDPFDDAFPNVHDSMFMMLQLMEFLVSDYLYDWITHGLEKELLEESLRWLVQLKKSLELLQNINCLYMIQLDRVIGELAKQVGRVPRLDAEKLINMDILESLIL